MASTSATSKLSSATVPASKDALLKSYRKRLKDDVGSMMTNFMEIIKLCKIEEESQVMRATQCEEDAFEMQVRAANMVSTTSRLTWSQKIVSGCCKFINDGAIPVQTSWKKY